MEGNIIVKKDVKNGNIYTLVCELVKSELSHPTSTAKNKLRLSTGGFTLKIDDIRFNVTAISPLA